ncbi:MAG: acyltransferase-domain-containing protein [Benjaminiella poitrasii]|nr:MAG: acyltransferase-domain-containing protein [Benjaminiella poitrasii]
MTSSHVFRLTKKKLGLLSTVALGATYWYYKPVVTNPTPVIPYIPPPFVWESIPKPVLKRFTVPLPSKDSTGWMWSSTVVIGVTGVIAKGFLQLSKCRVYNLERFEDLLHDPNRKAGIITVSNHESVLDDPLLWGALPLRTLFSQKMRWTLAAADICYTSIFKSYFFTLGKTIPTIRGAGIYQPGVDFAIEKLKRGSWIHIFPESKVTQGKDYEMIRFKWGVGHILMDAEEDVIVVPIWHQGMDLAKPLYGTPLVHLGKPISIVFGEPVDYSDIITAWKEGKLTREETRIKLTDRCYEALERLRLEYR